MASAGDTAPAPLAPAPSENFKTGAEVMCHCSDKTDKMLSCVYVCVCVRELVCFYTVQKSFSIVLELEDLQP